MNGKLSKREKFPCSENCQRECVILQIIPGMDNSIFGKFSIPGNFFDGICSYVRRTLYLYGMGTGFFFGDSHNLCPCVADFTDAV